MVINKYDLHAVYSRVSCAIVYDGISTTWSRITHYNLKLFEILPSERGRTMLT
jgi:hypothetical protein